MLTRILTLVALTAASSAAAEADRIMKLPPLPVSATPEKDEAMVELGRLLFFDPRLSGDSSTSCASCHAPEYGYGDGAELSRGYPGTKHWRNAQTLVNSAYLTNGLHWDGSVGSLLHQVPGAMGTAFAANIDVTMAEERMKQIPEYRNRFLEIWGEDPTIEQITQAIAAYEHSLVSADSPFDRFAAGDVFGFSPEAARGQVIFAGKGNCVSCHNGALATDEDFHNTSVPRNPEFLEDPLVQVTFRSAMRGFGVAKEVYEGLDRDPGLYAVTQNDEDMGKFRTPPLRYLTFTAPYMHNGIFYTLDEVVNFYDAGGTEDVFGTKSAMIEPLGLTDQEKSDLVAFLESLSGTEIVETYPDLPDYETVEVAVKTSACAGDFAANASAATSVAAAETPAESSFSSTSAGLVIDMSGGTAPTAEPSSGRREVIVQVGDNLGIIAQREYGDVLRYQDIYEANKDLISDPSNLAVGTVLVIPEL